MLSMNDIPLLLQSCEGRGDIIVAWKAVTGMFWPDLPFDVHILDGNTMVAGWSRRLKRKLESLKSPVVVNWLDDQFMFRSADTELVRAPLKHLIETKDIAAIYLYTGQPTHGPELGLEGHGRYQHRQPYYHWTQNGPLLWKRKALILTCDWIINNFVEEADKGWTGAYNWELNAGHALVENGLHVCGPCTEDYAPVEHRNGITQNLWTLRGLKLAQNAGVEPDLTKRGMYKARSGLDGFLDRWRKTKKRKR